jgi:hypothetical protein
LLDDAPFYPNGLRFGPFDQNGLIFRMRPGKAPGAEGGRGEETSPFLHVLARPNKGSSDVYNLFVTCPFASAHPLVRDLFRHLFLLLTLWLILTPCWLHFGILLAQCWSCLIHVFIYFEFFVHQHPSFRHPKLQSTCSQPLDTLVERTPHSKATCGTLPKATYAPTPEL